MQPLRKRPASTIRAPRKRRSASTTIRSLRPPWANTTRPATAPCCSSTTGNGEWQSRALPAPGCGISSTVSWGNVAGASSRRFASTRWEFGTASSPCPGARDPLPARACETGWIRSASADCFVTGMTADAFSAFSPAARASEPRELRATIASGSRTFTGRRSGCARNRGMTGTSASTTRSAKTRTAWRGSARALWPPPAWTSSWATTTMLRSGASTRRSTAIPAQRRPRWSGTAGPTSSR